MTTLNRAEGGLVFGSRKDACQKFRLSYPSTLFDIILNALPLNRNDCSVDFGAGTGHTTEPLLGRFGRVVAVETDERMAEKITPANNLSVIVSKSEDASFEENSIDLITCGTAFYWMEGPLVLERFHNWIRPGGLPLRAAHGPTAVLDILNREFKDHWDEFRHERLLDEAYSERVLRESNLFKTVETQSVANVKSMTAESFIGFFWSTSYVGQYLRSIDDPGGYLAGLVDEVTSVTDGKPFDMDFAIHLIIAETQLYVLSPKKEAAYTHSV